MADKKSGSWDDSKSLARAVLHDRAERRKWLGRMVQVPLLMLCIGLWALNGWIWASPWRVLFWWGGCTLATFVVILFALYDALVVVREEREKERSKIDRP